MCVYPFDYHFRQFIIHDWTECGICGGIFFPGGRSCLWPHGPIKWRDSYALFEMNMNLTFLFLYVKYNSCVTVWPLFGQWCSYPMWNVYSTCPSRSSSLTDGFGISFSFFYEKNTPLLLLFSSPSWISLVSHRLILYAILHFFLLQSMFVRSMLTFFRQTTATTNNKKRIA